MKHLLGFLIVVLLIPYSVLAAAAGGTLPTRVEIEKHLASVDQQAAMDVLQAMDPTREYEVLVKVTLDPLANWDELQETPSSDENYLPGTIRKNAEISQEMRERVLQTLPKKREVLVLTPSDAPGDIEKWASAWVGRKLSFKSADTISFQHQLKAREPASEPPKEGFVGSGDYWRAIIIASAFVAAVFLLLLFMVFMRAGRTKDAKAAVPAPRKSGKDGNASSPATTANTGAAVAGEAAPGLHDQLQAISRIASFNPEISSLAFMGLVSRAEDLALTAKVVHALGMDQALHLFPKATGASWARLGGAIGGLGDEELTLEEGLQFARALNGEIARMQFHASSSKFLPNLEAKGAGEIVNQIRSAGAVRGSTLMALLSDSALTEVAPKLSNRELGSLLKSLPGVAAVPMREIERFDKGEMLVDVASQAMPIEPFAKMATILSSLAPADEFALFDNLMTSASPGFLGQIAPFRLYPPHITYMPKDVVASVIQSMELDNLRALMQTVKGNVRTFLMSYMSSRQKDTVEESAGESGASPEALREFLNAVHTKLGQSASSDQIASIFHNERAA